MDTRSGAVEWLAYHSTENSSSVLRLCAECKGSPVARMMVEHIGSTAVPGPAAKPVIDVGLGIRSLTVALALLPAIQSPAAPAFPLILRDDDPGKLRRGACSYSPIE